MAHINWSSELGTGIQEIDDQHKQLIQIANALIDAIQNEDGRKKIDAILKRLREYTVFHFNSEEAFMSKVRYPKRGDQVAEHKRLKQDVKEFQRRVYKHTAIQPAEVLAFLRKWLLDHILTYDRDLASFVKEEGRRLKPVSVGKK